MVDYVARSHDVSKMSEIGRNLDRFDDDLFTVLTDKADGEAAIKVKGRGSQGILVGI